MLEQFVTISEITRTAVVVVALHLLNVLIRTSTQAKRSATALLAADALLK
ncbi:MAG: hypothetical protein R3F50_11770 [Gammaproteobacteria bacterium]|jgi:hypothetical protein